MRKNIFKITCATLLVGFTISGCFVFNNKLSHVNIDGHVFSLDSLDTSIIDYLTKNVHVFNKADFNEFVRFNVSTTEITERSFLTKVHDLFSKKVFDLVYTIDYDIQGLSDYIDELNSLADEQKDAYIIKSDDCFTIVPEVYGDIIDKDSLIKSLESDVSSIRVEDFYVQPKIKQKDLESKLSELNNLATWFCKYTDGTVLKSSVDYIDYNDGIITTNTEWILESIEGSLDSYNTVGSEKEFKTTGGNIVKVSGGTWGSIVDYDTEVESLANAFTNGISLIDKEPEYKQYYNDIGDTYIEVSLENQYVWVYKDGSLIMETDCVSGDVAKKYNTPTGVYFISECIDGKYLKGDGYKTWVNKWMRLTNRGHGLHDASWRGKFGGNIYLYNGSHGCINLPKKFAYELYKEAYVGMPVIIY